MSPNKIDLKNSPNYTCAINRDSASNNCYEDPDRSAGTTSVLTRLGNGLSIPKTRFVCFSDCEFLNDILYKPDSIDDEIFIGLLKDVSNISQENINGMLIYFAFELDNTQTKVFDKDSLVESMQVKPDIFNKYSHITKNGKGEWNFTKRYSDDFASAYLESPFADITKRKEIVVEEKIQEPLEDDDDYRPGRPWDKPNKQ